MAATGTPTPNIGLRIPQGTDPASVDDINYNSNLLDTKLGAVGNTSVQDQIDSLNSNIGNLTTVTTNFTPTIASASPGFTTSNIVFEYMRVGKLMFISGRFNITDVGTSPSQSTVFFTLPTGYSCDDFVGAVGSIALNKAGVDITKFSIRQGSNSFYIQEGAGGSSVLSVIGTGYVMLYATIMLK